MRVRRLPVAAHDRLEEAPREVRPREPVGQAGEAVEGDLGAPRNALERRERGCEPVRVGGEIARPAVQQVECGFGGQPPADERLVHPVSGERVDESGCVADEQDAPFDRPPRRAAHREPVSPQGAHFGLVDPERGTELLEPLPQPRTLALAAPDADVDMVALRKHPGVAASDDRRSAPGRGARSRRSLRARRRARAPAGRASAPRSRLRRQRRPRRRPRDARRRSSPIPRDRRRSPSSPPGTRRPQPTPARRETRRAGAAASSARAARPPDGSSAAGSEGRARGCRPGPRRRAQPRTEARARPGQSARRRRACPAGTARGRSGTRARPRARGGRPSSSQPARRRRRSRRSAART